MSLTAAGRFAGSLAVREGRRGVVLGASVGLHGALLLAMVMVGHRMVSLEAPSAGVEMRFEAAVVPLAETGMPPESADAAAVPVAAETPVPMAAEAAAPAVVAEAPPAAEVEPPALAEPVHRVAAPRRQARPVTHAVAARPVTPAVVGSVVAPPVLAPVAAAVPVRAATISARWQGELAGWIRSRTRYPEEAKQRGEQGAVVVSFTVGRDGQVLGATLRQRSGSDALDQAALAMFRAARVPAFPPDMAAAEVTISVPVRYRLEP